MIRSKRFYQMVIPSVGASLVTALYFVVDGIFVGNGIGMYGLAAVNLAVPFITILTAVSMMITMGGATITSIRFGKGDEAGANRSFLCSLWMVVGFAAFMSIVSLLFPEAIARALGASELLLADTAEYLKNYVLFGIFLCGSMTLSTFVRNDGNPRLAFWGMIVGAVSNVFLDWLFIFPLQMGVRGAAIASGLGQVMACLTLLTHFATGKGKLRLRGFMREAGLLREIALRGLPEFIAQMSQPVTILCYNLIVIRVFGEVGVSAFSVVAYLTMITCSIFLGVSQGIQPLISFSVGEGKPEQEQYYFTKGIRTNLILAVFCNLLFLMFGKQIISMFNSDAQLIDLAYSCINIYGISFLFASVNIIYTTYYLASKRTREAIIIAVLRSFVCNTLFIFLVPMLFGEGAIWLGIAASELLVMLVCLVLRRYSPAVVSGSITAPSVSGG